MIKDTLTIYCNINESIHVPSLAAYTGHVLKLSMCEATVVKDFDRVSDGHAKSVPRGQYDTLLMTPDPTGKFAHGSEPSNMMKPTC